MNFGKILICLILEIKVHVIISNQMNHKSQNARTLLPTKIISYESLKSKFQSLLTNTEYHYTKVIFFSLH